MSLLSISTGALLNAQVALRTTTNNIANAATEGYSRQRVQSVSQPSNKYASKSWIGNGAAIAGIERVNSNLLNNQVNISTSAVAKNDTFLQRTEQLEGLLANLDTNISSNLGEFYASANALSTSPSSSSARARYLSAAGTVANQFQELNMHFDNMTKGLNDSLSGMVADVNMMSKQLAEINNSKDSGSNELLDQQEVLLNRLAQIVSIQAIRSDNGKVDVFMSNGQPLVIKGSSHEIAAFRSLDDPEFLDIGAVQKDGSVRQLSDNAITGGEIAGLLTFRKEALNAARNELGRMAMTFAHAANEFQKMGQTSAGVQGTDMYFYEDPTVFTYSANTGDGKLSATITNMQAVTAASYRLVKTSAGWDATNLDTNVTTSLASLPADLDGMSIDVASGTFVDGDRFRVDPTRTGMSSIKMILNNTGEIATGYPINASADAANTGSARVGEIRPASSTWDPNLKNTLDLTYSAGSWTIAGAAPDSVTSTTEGWTIEQNGWILKIQGTPSDGDVFHVKPTSGSGDGRAVADLSSTQHDKIVGGTMSTASAYSTLVNNLGSNSRIATSSLAASQSILDQAKGAKDNVSGVNLDEEAANLVKWQQMYQAASKLVSITNSMLDSLFAVLN